MADRARAGSAVAVAAQSGQHVALRHSFCGVNAAVLQRLCPTMLRFAQGELGEPVLEADEEHHRFLTSSGRELRREITPAMWDVWQNLETRCHTVGILMPVEMCAGVWNSMSADVQGEKVCTAILAYRGFILSTKEALAANAAGDELVLAAGACSRPLNCQSTALTTSLNCPSHQPS